MRTKAAEMVPIRVVCDFILPCEVSGAIMNQL